MNSSIALVVLDSVRKDVFDKYFDWLPGIRFENAYSTGNYSIPAHGSLFGGRYPSELGVHAKSQVLDCPESVLAERLRDSGYRTRAYSANALIGPEFGFDRGFDEFNLRWNLSDSIPEFFPWREELTGDNTSILDYPRAVMNCVLDSNSNSLQSIKRAFDIYSYNDEGASEALKFLDTIDFGDSEFLFLNLMEAHWPYWGEAEFLTYNDNPVDANSETIPGGDINLSAHREGYNEWVAYLSKMYKQILDRLLNDFEYIVTIADHGDLFGEHGAKAHYYGLFEDLIKVPLVISGDVENETYRDDIVSLVDVHATVCAMAGIPSVNRGVNLLGSAQKEPRLIEFHGFRPDRIESLRNDGYSLNQIEHYDKYMTAVAMPDGYYGYETPNGFEESGAPIEDPRQAIEQLCNNLDQRTVSRAEEQPVSEGTRERLQKLGYIN